MSQPNALCHFLLDTPSKLELSLYKIMALDFGNGGLHDEVKTITIRIFSSHEVAQLAASNLEAHGIKCWVNADDCGGMYPNLTAPGGVRLLVCASDVEAAMALLNTQASALEISQLENEAAATSPLDPTPQKKLALGQILIGVFVGVLLCLLFQPPRYETGTTKHFHYVNGKADEEWIYYNGWLVEFLQDRNLDGKWDHWTHYNEKGEPIDSEYDNNFDGKPDEWWMYSNDVLVSMEKDADFNGIPDVFCTYKYGLRQYVDIRPNNSKFPTQRWIYRNNVLTEILKGGNSNGIFNEDVHYDPFLNPIDTNANGFRLLSTSPK
jgi:hypothetical protein